MTQRERPVIAIDGPAGAGKSTAARRLAEALGFVLVDTGALYRAVALIAKEREVAWSEGAALGELATGLSLAFEPAAGGAPRLIVEGVDRGGDIRTPDISQGASIVSKHPEVRAALLGLQRRLGSAGGVVLEGRDIGTVVFPDAELKVFLTASVEARADRRVLDLERREIAADRELVLSEIRERDERDSTRAVAPLRPAEDAIVVDSSNLTLNEVVAHLVGLAQALKRVK